MRRFSLKSLTTSKFTTFRDLPHRSDRRFISLSRSLKDKYRTSRYLPVILISVFIFVNLILHINRVPLFHEEPRRAIIAQEMILTGDYILPKVYQEFYHKKPPLHNWLIAAVSIRDGIVSNFNARIVSVVSLLLVGITVYLLLLRISVDMAFVAFIISVTNYSMLYEYGNKAEPEILQVLFTWLAYFFYIKNPADIRYITISSVCMGLGILTKGVSPLFFYPGLVLHALLNPEIRIKRLKSLFFHLVLSSVLPLTWVVWYYFRTDSHSFINGFLFEVGGRAKGNFRKFFSYLLIYPWEVLAALLPWSLVLFFTFKKEKVKDEVYESSFLIFASSFLIFMITAGSRSRHLMPAFPFFAIVSAFHISPHKPLNQTFSRLSLWVFSGVCLSAGIYFLRGSFYVNGVVFFLLAVISGLISRKQYLILDYILILSLLYLVAYENGIYFHKIKTRPDYKDTAGFLVKDLDKSKPIVIDTNVVHMRLALDIERTIRKPVYSRRSANFDDYYLIAGPQSLNPSCRELSRVNYPKEILQIISVSVAHCDKRSVQ